MLLVHRLWNIQKIRQYLNWESAKTLKCIILLLKGRRNNFAILERVLNFWLTLLQSFRTCLSNFKSLSELIPRSLTSLLSQIKSYPIFICPFLFMFMTRNYQMAFICVQFHIIIFIPMFSKHRVFLKWFQNFLNFCL